MKLTEAKEVAEIAALMDAIRDLRKVMLVQFSQKMKEQRIDLTIEMLEVLYLLWDKDNINQQEIVDKTNRNKASVTSLIDNLTNRDLVQRNPDPKDRRNKLIALTPKGEAYQERIIPILKEVYSAFQVDVSKEEIDRTTAVLKNIRQKMIQ